MNKEIEFVREKHINYLNFYTKVSHAEELIFNETLKMCGVFYFICSCKLLSHKIDKKKEFIDFILKCQNLDGGFGNNVKHDSHIVSTHYAILSLFLLNYSFDNINKYIESEEDENEKIELNIKKCIIDTSKYCEKNIKSIKENVCIYIMTLSNDDGSFKGDVWGEIDTRFVYSAISCLSILNKLSLISKKKVSSYLLSNYDLNDNGFSWVSGNEPHAASVFCCVSTLFIIQKLYLINENKLADWLSLRQTNNGGFNGRPEKLTDTCYSWWIFSSLTILKKYKWIDQHALKNYILLCQDLDNGGISDNPDCLPDICHTFFGLAALSLIENLDKSGENTSLKEIHPVYAIPLSVVKRSAFSYDGVDAL